MIGCSAQNSISGIGIWTFGRTEPLPYAYRILLLLVFSSLSSTDLFPAFVQHDIIWPYAVKTLPVSLCWLLMLYEFWREAFKSN